MEKIVVINTPELEAIVYSSVKKAMSEFKEDKPTDAGNFLTLKEAAQFLNLARQTIYGLTCKRQIPFLKRGKKLYFKKDDLVKWLELGRKFSY